MGKISVKIGVVCLARKTFDFNAASDIYKRIQTDLKKIPQVEWRFIPELIIEEEEAIAAALDLKSKNCDALIAISGTFHLGELILQLDRICQRPLLLWGLYELPYDGGRIRLNSVCGLNLDSSNLFKTGNHNFHYVIGNNVNEDWIDAIRVLKAFSSSKIGIIGHHAKGFYNIDVDEPILFRETGVLFHHYELKEVWDEKVTDIDVGKRREQIKELFDIGGISTTQLDKVAQLTVKFASFMDRNQLSGLAVRCWPEFAAEFGISPCAAMSILQAEDYLLGCEGDILGLMSMVAQKAVGGENPFLTDFSQVDFEQNFALLWHCGVAACNLWDEKCVRSLDSYFAGGKGVTADFVMKSGKVSLLRIDSSGETFRVFIQSAAGLPMKKELKGTYLKAQFTDDVRMVLEKIITNGIAHHISIVYGNFLKPFEILANIKGWRIIQ